MTTIKFTLEGLKQSFNYIEKEKEYIGIDDILLILQKREIQKNEVEFIKYLNTEYNAWDPIDNNEKIKLNKEKGVKLLIKIKRKVQNERQNKKKEELFGKMQIIDKKINEILLNENEKNNAMKKEDSSMNIQNIKSNRSLSISDTPENETINDINFINSEMDLVDIIVLTGNPLIDKTEDYIKELRTVNDFNFVTYLIHKVILDCNKQINTKFLPLTLTNFNKAILLRPKILHLICKSTYLSNINKNEMDKNIINEEEIFSPYLLFENEKCEMERINGESFKKIIEAKGGKGLLKNISLLISTPLAQDIFEMVKPYPFKNIIVQHINYANVPFIAELNEQFYENIIEQDKSIEESFNIAKSINISKNKISNYQSCCCFHSHLNKCEFKSHLSNELYIESGKQNLVDIFCIPHFYHLRYMCTCKQDNFCIHKNKCDNYKYSFKNLLVKDKKHLICCEKENILHNLNNIFFWKFSKEKESYGLFSNYQTNNFGTIDQAEFVPNYDKMDLIVGRNKIIYNIFELLNDNSFEIINIYGHQYVESISMIDNFIDIIIEFLKERIPYIISDLKLNLNNDSSDNSLDKPISSSSLLYNKSNSDSQNNINMQKTESAPLLKDIYNNNPTFEKIVIRKDFQENNITIINQIANDNNKKIYFINAVNIKKKYIQEKLKRREFFKKQIIVFTEDKLEKINEKSIKHIQLNNLTENDYRIKLQRQKITSFKDNYDIKVRNEMIKNSSKFIEEDIFNNVTVYKDYQKANFIYEILFLFNCSMCGHFLSELTSIFGNKANEVKEILEKKYVPKNIIKRIEKVEGEKGGKKEHIIYHYVRKNPVFKNYYEVRKNNITDTVKRRVFQKLFQFYSLVFRLIIKESKKKIYQLKERGQLKLNKKYKPLDSLTTFSAIQELGMWKCFEKKSQDEDLIISDIVGYFNHLLRNFKCIFKNDNIILCFKDKETWEKVSNDIEDISITLPTCLKMFSIEKDENIITMLKEELKQLDRYSHSSLARIELFDSMSFEFKNHNIKNIENLNEIEKKFLEYGYKQGILETLFAKCFVKYRESQDYKEFDDDKLKNELKDFEDDKHYCMENKDIFITLFRSKIKYLYYKFKIKSSTLSEEDLLDLKELLKEFKNKAKILYAIKVCFLFSEWYLKKYKLGLRDGKTECTKEKESFMKYINFARYISNCENSEDVKRKYTQEILENKYKLTNINLKVSEEMNNKMKNLCNEYNFNFKENILKTYYIE